MKKSIFLIAFSVLYFINSGQNLNNFINKDIIISNDSIYIDTLSIVPNTFNIFFNNKLISDTNYSVQYANSLLIIDSLTFNKLKNRICKLNYRTFPLNFMQVYKHKSFINQNNNIRRHYLHQYVKEENSDFKNFSSLKKSGSISRGISFGNNQGAALNSDFNLQLSGKISPDIEIQANITDSNIPIQADGSSQNLREFDNVFIRLITKKSILEVGDLNMKTKEGYFIKFNKKVKGAGFSTSFNSKKINFVNTKFNAAVSKGTYNKMIFQGKEGNQGPYRLTGRNGELYVIILSGSEKIYLDGNLLIRGNENDYLMNYNSGEITFTTNKIITKDSRIIAEFEYSEMNYVRYTVGNSTSVKTKNSTLFLNLISEQDAKNNTVRQDLSSEQKVMFHNIGDDIQNAFVNNFVLSDTFNRDEVLYRKTDTTIQNLVYQTIFVYSTDSINAKYRVNFSFVGEHKGNYQRIQNGANGKVYQWISPIEGIPQGEYEPIKLLVSPKKKQMINAGAFGKINRSTSYYIESALSNNDLNTFSEIGDKDNLGYALKLGGVKNFLKKDTSESYLKFSSDYQFTSKYFDAFEPYKSPEFNRDWNLVPSKTLFDEHFASLKLIYFNKKNGKAGISSDLLIRNEYYKGNRNNFFINMNNKKLLIDINAKRLTTKDTVKQSEFLIYTGRVEGKLSKFSVGIRNSGEKNLFSSSVDTIVNSSSYRFNEFEAYLKTPVNSKHLLSVSYINREDFLPYENKITYASTAHNLKFKAALLNLKNQTIKTTFNYRKLRVRDSILTKSPSENTLSGRLNYSFKLFKGAVSSSSLAEHASGNEAVKEFSYLEVQSGQGIFAWKDFNSNQIKELNEFVKANFSDEANYIRIALPSSEYKTVYNQSVFEVFNLIPHPIWQNENGIKKVLSMFSNRFTFKLNRKINNQADYFNLNIPDNFLISKNKSVKNRFSLNIPKFQTHISYTYINSGTKNLLINGIDSRNTIFHTLEGIKKIHSLIFTNTFISGNKIYLSEFFSDNDYSINFKKNETSLNFKIDKKSSIKANFILKEKNNLNGEEEFSSITAGAEYQFSSVNQGRFQINFNFVNIHYSGHTNTAISYEILEGLQNGKNYLWSMHRYQKLTKSLQLELNYSGRKSSGSKIIHTGGMSIRAFF